MKLTRENLQEALKTSSKEKLSKIYGIVDAMSLEANLFIGDSPVSVLPVPLIINKAPVRKALSDLNLFIEALVSLERHLTANPGGNLFRRLSDSLTRGGRHLVSQCTYEDDESVRRRLRRIDGYLDRADGAYQIIEVNQAAPLALHFYDTSQQILTAALSELGFSYAPALISPGILDWFTGEYSRRNNGRMPETIALVVEHGYPPKFTDLPGMARRVEELARKKRGLELEITLCYPYEISLKNDRIMLRGRKTDMIWRNSVYMTEYRRQNLPIEDYEKILGRQDEFVVLNSTRSWLTRTKEVFALLWDDGACREAGFTPLEIEGFRRVIPFSLNLSLCRERMDEVIKDREQWILKPADSGFGKGVEFGASHTPLQWEALVREKAVPGQVFQKKVKYSTAALSTFDRQGRLMEGLVEYDFCPHHVNGSFTGTALIRANPAGNQQGRGDKTMNLCSGGSLMPLALV